MQALGVLVLMLAVAGSAHAQGRVLRSRSGAEIPIPPGFDTLDRAELGGARDDVEAAYRRVTKDERAVVLVVLRWSVDNVNRDLAELPRRSGPLPQRFADEVAAVMHKEAGNERLYTEVVPLLYDDSRHAFGIELRTRGESPARALLGRPDGSPEWQQLAGAGADPATFRCLLGRMAAAFEDGAPARASGDAARDCAVPRPAAATLLEGLKPAFFERSRFVERIFQIVTARGATMVKLEADASDLPALEEAWQVVWTKTEVAPEARPRAGLARRMAILKDRPANLLGAVLGSLGLVFVLGLAVGLGLWKLRVPVPLAALLGQGLVLGLLLTFSGSDTREGELTAVGVIRIVVSLMVLPITTLALWLWSRRAKARQEASSAPSDRAQSG